MNAVTTNGSNAGYEFTTQPGRTSCALTMTDPKLVFMSMDDFVRLTDEVGPLPTAAPDMTSPDKPHQK